jgi:hypothetical protein
LQKAENSRKVVCDTGEQAAVNAIRTDILSRGKDGDSTTPERKDLRFTSTQEDTASQQALEILDKTRAPKNSNKEEEEKVVSVYPIRRWG